MARFAGVIFDLDGVLVDTEIWWDEVRREFAAAHGRTWGLDDRAAVMGANSRQWSRTMAQRLRLDMPPGQIERAVVDAMGERYRLAGVGAGGMASAGASGSAGAPASAEAIASGEATASGEAPAATPDPAIPGAIEAVRRLARTHPLGLASSAHREVIDAALRTTGLADAFRVVVSSDEVARGKPEPDVYLETARRLGVAPRDCLVIEDSLNGVLAARAAGMTVVLIPNAGVPPAAGAGAAASLVLDSITDLDADHVPGL